MNEHEKDFYNLATASLNKQKVKVVDINVLEYVCRYHTCNTCKKEQDRKKMYSELSRFFNKETVNVILQLTFAINKIGSVTYDKWKEYLIAFKDADMSMNSKSLELAKKILKKRIE